MNQAFLEDLWKEVELQEDHETAFNLRSSQVMFRLQLYIAEKLWSIEQLLKNQEQR